MKETFEKPFLEVEHFELQDAILTSGGVDPAQAGTAVGDDGGTCHGDKTDNYNFTDCV